MEGSLLDFRLATVELPVQKGEAPDKELYLALSVEHAAALNDRFGQVWGAHFDPLI
jgi:hypothetical protein